MQPLSSTSILHMFIYTFSPACVQSLHWVRHACIQAVSFRSALDDLCALIHCDLLSTHVWNMYGTTTYQIDHSKTRQYP